MDIIAVIKEVGFPIFVAVWLLIKDQREKKATREAIARLSIAINSLIENLKKKG